MFRPIQWLIERVWRRQPRAEESPPCADAEIRAWILAALRAEASRQDLRTLFFRFDPASHVVRVDAAEHLHVSHPEEQYGSIRVGDWSAFRDLFRECATPHLTVPLCDAPNIVIFNWASIAHEIRVVLYDPVAFRRGARLAGSTEHDCEAGCCGCSFD